MNLSPGGVGGKVTYEDTLSSWLSTWLSASRIISAAVVSFFLRGLESLLLDGRPRLLRGGFTPTRASLEAAATAGKVSEASRGISDSIIAARVVATRVSSYYRY